MGTYIQLVPAYGRDYKNKKGVLADWSNGKDFQIVDVMNPDCGRYANKADLNDGKYTHVIIRYDKTRKLVTIKL